jgi:AraC-like DNA-binding protein
MKSNSKQELFAHCFDVKAYEKKIPEIRWLPYMRGLAGMHVLEELSQPSTQLCLNPVQLHSLRSFVQNHSILCLDEHFSKADLNPYFPLAVEICKVKGKLMAIPEDISPHLLFYRNDLLSKYGFEFPETLSEFRHQLEHLKKKTGKCAFGVHGGGIKTRLGFFCSVFGAFGAHLDDKFEHWPNDSDRMVAAYEWIRELHNRKLLKNFDLMIRRLNLKHFPRDEFSGGDSIFHPMWLSNVHLTWKRSFLKNVRMAFFPPLERGMKIHYPLSGHAWIIPANVADPSLAIKVLKKTQDRALLKGNELKKGFPFLAWQSLWNDPDILKKHPVYQFSSILKKVEHGYLVTHLSRKFELLDGSIRQGIRENLKGRDWIRLLFTREFTTSRKLTSNDVIKRALDYMEQNLHKIRSANQIATHVKMTKSYFPHFFRRHMKMGCGAYLMRIRMEKAQSLLKEKNCSIKEISARLGFKYQQDFTRSFRKYWKKNPSDIKREQAN